ncbi:MAG: hypothetical protein ACI8XO_001269 [Verrucomicrobiales bacterium]|jgi:hypothetical protein
MTDPRNSACPGGRTLEALATGRLDEAALLSIEDHLESCERCQSRLDRLSKLGEVERSDIVAAIPDEDSRREIEELSPILKRLPTGSAPPACAPFVIPGHLGSYDVREMIARGGMGVVLEAWDPDLRRSVAIKQLSPELADDDAARERFISEARAVAALDHENILPIFAVETDPSASYLVMPLVDGESLQQRLDRDGALTNDEVLSFGMKIVAGLEFAHSQGIVHRDLKPGNILLDRDCRRLWIADFGLARVAGQKSRVTEISGTLAFMAPEEIGGAVTDRRADLFSLGATLYAMATGRPPFEAASGDALVRQIEQDPVLPPNTLSPDLDPVLGRIIERLLEKDPDDRFQSAADVREAMVPLAERPRSRWLLWPAFVGLVLVGLLAFFATQGGSVGTSDPSSPYALVGKGGEIFYFDTLSDAVENAGDGDAVEIQLDGEHPFVPVDLGERDLILRAAAGYSPVLQVQGTSAPAITTRGRLWLEGLAFQRKSAEGIDYPIVSGSGRSLWINNCLLSINSSDEASYPPPACIEVVDCEDFQLLNSRVLSQRFALVSSRNSRVLETQRIEIRNCALLGLWTLVFDQPGESRAKVVIEDCLMICRVGFYSLNRHRMVNSSFETKRNIFDTHHSLITISKAFPDQVKPKFDWSGEGNIFSTGAKYVESSDRTRYVRGIIQLEGWRLLVDEGDSSVEATIVDREVITNGGHENITKVDLKNVLRAPLGSGDLPDAGPHFEQMDPGENWRDWSQSEEGMAWHAEKLKSWEAD